MSNNPFKKKNVLAQIGNFVVTRDAGGEHEWISIKAVCGFWSLRFRDDNPNYGKILEMARNPQYHDLLRHIVNINFALSNTIPDGELAKDVYAALNGFVNRAVKRAGTPTEEMEAEALKEMETLHELQTELTELVVGADEGAGN